MGIFEYLAAKDITEKYGKGIGYSYIKEQLKQKQQEIYNQGSSQIEEIKEKYIKIVLDIYNDWKEELDNDFKNKFFNIITTYSTATVENINSVQLVFDTIIEEMFLTITIKDTINQINETIEANLDKEKIKTNKEILQTKLNDIYNTKDLQKAKQKLIEFVDTSKELGIKILNKEDLLEQLNNKL